MSENTKINGLIGLYFHQIENGHIGWQGCIISRPEPNFYIVQLFSWLSGQDSNCKLVELSEMKDWLFYQNQEAMIFAYEYGSAKRFRIDIQKKEAA